MKKKKLFARTAIAVALASFVFIAGGIYFNSTSKAQDDKMMNNKKMSDMPDLKGWPEASQLAAQDMMKKYGKPNEVTEHMLVWNNNGPWKRTMLTSEVVVHNWPTLHSDFLTQVIDYRVPPDKFSDIAKFDGSILLDRTKGEVDKRICAERKDVSLYAVVSIFRKQKRNK